jgi:hypothetical protein
METETVERTRKDGPQVGDVLVSSYGYDQTNVAFYRVVGLTASGKSVRIVPAGQRVVDYSKGGERVVPGELVTGADGMLGMTTSLIRWYEVRSWFQGRTMVEEAWAVGVPVGHRNTARLWDGRPVYQTAAGWGH